MKEIEKKVRDNFDTAFEKSMGEMADSEKESEDEIDSEIDD